MSEEVQQSTDSLIKHILKASLYCAKQCKTIMIDQMQPSNAECLNQCGYAFASSVYYQGEFLKYMQEVQEQFEQ